MKDLQFEYYLPVIKKAFAEVYGVRFPNVRGALNSVIIANTNDGEYVCKFNHRDLAIKNMEVSRIFNEKGIKVPEIKVYSYNNQCFEAYKIIPGKTLFEHIGYGLSEEKIKAVFRELLNQFAKMSEITPNIVFSKKYKHTYQVAKTNISDVNNRMLGLVFSGAVRLMNTTSKEQHGLYHCGITPKNIILDNNGNFLSLLDLDEIAIADKSYAFGAMATKYQQLGFDITELIDLYEKTTNQSLDHKRVRFMADLNNVGKRLLWKQAHSGHSK